MSQNTDRRELPRKMNIQGVAASKTGKKYVFFSWKPRSRASQKNEKHGITTMNIEEVEGSKKYENYHAKPVSDPFKTIAEHRKVR